MKNKITLFMPAILSIVLIFSSCNNENKKSQAETDMKDTIITRIDSMQIQTADGTWKDTAVVHIDSMKIENNK